MWQGSLRGRRVAAVLLGASATALLAGLATATSAFALGTPVTVAAAGADHISRPSVSVDANGDALIAWMNDENATTTGDFVQYCVLPVGKTSCSQSGNLMSADPNQNISGVETLVDGSTMIVLADQFGGPESGSFADAPVQEWQSTDGGATWSLAAGGQSVANGLIDDIGDPLSAVIVPGTGVLGFGWETQDSPTFNAFPLSDPPECTPNDCPAGFATLPGPAGPYGGEFASIPSGPSAGVLGVFETLNDSGPLGCANSNGTGFGTAFVYGSGAQSATNNYNVSPDSGPTGSAWKGPVKQADCNVEYPAVGGGASGFGVLEATGYRVVYHRFDATNDAFDTPLVTVDGSGQGEQQPALSQDGNGGVYATYLLTPSGKPLMLAYSGDGGQTFSRVPLASGSTQSIADSTSSVNATGQGWAVWFDVTSDHNTGPLLAEPFQKADAVPPLPPSFVGSPMVRGRRVTLPLTVPSYPAVFSITLTAPETVMTHHRRTTKIVIIAKSRFTTRFAARGGPGDQAGTTVTLNFGTVNFSYTAQVSPGAGQTAISAGSRHVKARVAVTESAEGILRKLTRTVVLTLPPHPPRR